MPASSNSAIRRIRGVASTIVVALVGLPLPAALAQPLENPYVAASRAPKSQAGWERFAVKVEEGAPFDEAMGGVTSRGTPLTKRDEACFPTEPRNLFWQVDMVAGADGKLHSLFEGEPRTNDARAAIRGQNTWMLWSEGDEAFWNWLLQERNYGITDFLILLDSRRRDSRFRDAGLINQPGMKAQTDSNKGILGLYLDQADGEKILLQPPQGGESRTSRHGAPTPPPHCHPTFVPGDKDLYDKTMQSLATDGVDPDVYGYPSGVVGLRLFPNPDYFGEGDAATEARRYWKERVINRGDDYYDYRNHPELSADPNLVRPFRVGMTCAFCHISPHPLNPPGDPEHPEWANLSSLIGAQYWDGTLAFSNLKKATKAEREADRKAGKEKHSFFYELVASWQPGTLDTSLVSTDQLNNPVTMNPVFQVPARLDRARLNPPEMQSAANLLIPGIEDPQLSANPRHVPRALLDGSDSIGIWGALARVYLNVGTYSEQWRRLHNPIIGYRAQRPFEIATLEAKSVYWRAGQVHRIRELLKFLTYENKAGETFTAPMKLAHAPGGNEYIARESEGARASGRAVFIENCAICHSSKQPEGFALTFSRKWASQRPPAAGEPARFVLPMDFAEWEAFKLSGAYREYVKRIKEVAGDAAGEPDPFLKDNYLSTDIRVPVTLVGTNSARTVGTNAMKGQVWDNFSSDTYKNLPAVGPVHFYNPYSGRPVDDWGNNDVYYPPGGGPGYYRPASLVGIWATAPFLHNNALGRYTQDPSVKGRMDAFDDAVDKLLWKAERIPGKNDRPGDLRLEHKELAGHDPGFIYRTTERSWLDFPGKFIRILVAGILGESLTSFLARYLWWGLAAIAFILAFVGRQRDVGFVVLLGGVLVAALLRITHADKIYPWLWWIPAAALAVAFALWLGPRVPALARVFFILLGAGSIYVSITLGAWVDGKRDDFVRVGPIPQGTPVNLLMNVNPQAPIGDLVDAVSGLARGLLAIHKGKLSDEHGAALRAFEAEAGLPLLKASKCPDFVLDRGHWFAEGLGKEQKQQLKAFLKTL